VLAAVQVPVLLAGPPVQSALVQQLPAAVGIHRLVPGQFLKLELHEMPQFPLVQLAVPLADGVGQALHEAPQKLVLMSGWQMPPQLCDPAGQTPLHALVVGMHAPAHSLVLAGHAGTQARPSQVTVPPPVGATHASHDVTSVGPQVATALLSAHWPLHKWKPDLHARPHAPATQAAVPLGSVGQFAHMAPQPVGSVSGAQRVPQRW
jgi:hypothetical protein